jgi:hypothetical protein
MTIRRLIALLFIALVSVPAHGAATRTIDADAVSSSDHSKTWTMPGSTGTLMLVMTAVQETPSGSGTSFTLAFTPLSSASVSIYINGLLQTQGSGKDYTISGTSITLAASLDSTQVIWAVYWK